MGLSEIIATSAFVKSLARKLKEQASGPLPKESDLALGIGHLIEDGFFDIAGIDTDDPDEVNDRLLDQFEKVVKDYQTLFSDNLFPSGVLRFDTLQVLKRSTCKGERINHSKPDLKNPDLALNPDPFSTDRPLLLYFVESLPAVSRAEDIIATATEIWSNQINLDIHEAEKEDEANVKIKLANLDGPGRNLGDADKGPPRAKLMEIRYDESEDWSQDKLFFAAIHEFGHILGLRHSENLGDIMFKQFQPDFFKLDHKDTISQNDITEIQAIWGKRKKKK